VYGRVEGGLTVRTGLHAAALNRWWYWIWSWLLPARATERPLPEETHPDVLSFPGHAECWGRGSTALQLSPRASSPYTERRFCGSLGQRRTLTHRSGHTTRPGAFFRADEPIGEHGDVCFNHHLEISWIHAQ